MLSGQKIHLFETKRLTRDGRLLDVQLSSTLYFDEAGNPAGNIVTLRDISAQKNAERELLKYHGQLGERVAERTAELAARNQDLERFNRLFVDRELRMKELKQRIKELEGKETPRP